MSWLTDNYLAQLSREGYRCSRLWPLWRSALWGPVPAFCSMAACAPVAPNRWKPPPTPTPTPQVREGLSAE